MTSRTSLALLLSFALAPALLPALAPTPARADTITLAPARDNTLYEDATGALSNGAGPTLFAGRTNQISFSIRRGLLAFDLSSIPAGSTITGAQLVLHVGQGSATPRTTTLHRVLANWGEGASDAGPQGGAGAAATAGDATWLHTFFSSAFWAAPGGDFVVAASASQAVADVGFYGWGSTAAMVADVQQWLDAPASDAGWLLRGLESASATARRYDSRESTTPSFRPALTIEFTPPPTATATESWGAVKRLYR